MRIEYAPGARGELRHISPAEVLERGRKLARRANSTPDYVAELKRQRRARERRELQADRMKRVGYLRRITNRDQLRGFTVHEAAHAVGGVLDGAGIQFIELEFTERNDGAHLVAGIYIPRDWDRVSARTLLAGRIAADRAGFVTPASWSAKDDSMARATGEDLVRARREAREMVGTYWGAIENLAAEVERFGHVDGDTAEMILWASGVRL